MIPPAAAPSPSVWPAPPADPPDPFVPDPDCPHPPERLYLVRYEAETPRTPRRYVRVYACGQCEAHVDDDRADGSLALRPGPRLDRQGQPWRGRPAHAP